MATASTKAKVKKGAGRKAAEPKAEAKVEKKEKAPKATPDFTVADVWNLGKEFQSSVRSSINDYSAAVEEMNSKAVDDPKTYRDHITAIKFQQRRVDRITLSLDELENGMKERKPREAKPKDAAKSKAKKKAEAEAEDEDEEAVEEALDIDDDDDDDEDDDDLD